MNEIDQDIVGTPAEMRKIKAETLRQFKDTPGYKVLADFVRDKQAELMRALIDGLDDIDLIQLRADMRAWYHLLNYVDDEVDNYDAWVKQTLDIKKMQENAMQRNSYGR